LLPEQVLCDPDAPLVKAAATKSGAFDVTEKPVVSKATASATAKAAPSPRSPMPAPSKAAVRLREGDAWRDVEVRVLGHKVKCFAKKADADNGGDPTHVLVRSSFHVSTSFQSCWYWSAVWWVVLGADDVATSRHVARVSNGF
jgi:hypothetical protein